MALTNINKTLLQSKFRGCLLGSLVGDCCGAPFEGDTFSTGAKIILQRYFDKLEGPYFKAPIKKYTEDSSMTKCVAQCLIDKSADLDTKNLARSFTKEFLNDPRRGYAENLVVIFNKLRANNFDDPFKPARETANFTTSNDNGGAMRIAPVALIHLDNYENMLNVAKISTELTHTNAEGVMGSLLQGSAIQQNILLDPNTEINIDDYTDKLLDKVIQLEKDNERLVTNEESFQKQVEYIKILLKKQIPPSDEEVLNKLGHSNRALYSVPTAIYCFLRSSKEIDEIETSNPFRRAIQYAISLGGDTDTIASMTGSLSGAYHGTEILNTSLLKHCEGSEHFKVLADKLFELAIKNK